jgi:hypothetical protein
MRTSYTCGALLAHLNFNNSSGCFVSGNVGEKTMGKNRTADNVNIHTYIDLLFI